MAKILATLLVLIQVIAFVLSILSDYIPEKLTNLFWNNYPTATFVTLGMIVIVLIVERIVDKKKEDEDDLSNY